MKKLQSYLTKEIRKRQLKMIGRTKKKNQNQKRLQKNHNQMTGLMMSQKRNKRP